MSTPKHDVHPAQCIIIGASLEGLLCAYLLRQIGHNVVVVEKNSEDVPRGVRAPPNAARLLVRLPGVKSLLQNKGTTASGLEYIEERLDQLDSPNFLTNHLRNLCRQAGIDIRYEVDIVSFSTSKLGRPIVTSKTGETIEGDLVVGADGDSGISRTFLPETLSDGDSSSSSTDSDEDSESTLQHTGIRQVIGATFCIPVASMRADPKLEGLTRSTAIKLWMISDGMVLGAMHGPELYIVVIMSPSKSDNVQSQGENADILEAFADVLGQCDSLVFRLLRLASHCHRERQVVPKVAPHLVDTTRNLALIGDAGIPGPFYGIYSDCLAIESAFTLPHLFSRLSSVEQIPLLLDGYQKIRTPRNLGSLSSELEAAALMSLPPSAERDQRDEALALALDQEDEASAKVWAATLIQFNYDAIEAVDEWWIEWGKFVMDGKGA
ncbi:FAD/NAD(P)-binding domain-containing protein [Guyanagaster necrorhizus]|uniref:FAD/NAD(P)-binding domain-containing protein n=1 Tax=Guyanagaster necrorhizus TaxID=856835 RepID=A0A9P8AVZ9_9AGAR|nr:FAD/NAD(P)-binding domain-containing protein [Guyanagaster necrorhizus MCA 3950]KAG7449855.1 FAD/NAD(P)-binding domain-containing protein [Guyanagaster necrorhizus MCA 3950]